ncbi:serine/threonine protein kinase [Nonomuraea sp. NPDC049480]|uniref:serine/threonine protein kinase n=1 Tax=Nonomuraea sp. NPDC049480 TaxID=3364353 RepID=UPI0037A92230
MPSISELRPGDPYSLGGYEIRGRLGEGGQGVVYLGESGQGRQAAIKWLRPHLAGDAVAAERFAREAAVSQRVAPFCTAKVLATGVHEDRPFIVSEYVDGPSLQQVVSQEGPRAEAALHRLAIGTATALAAIHQAGIVHRDFSPNNVLLGAEGPRVIDFGIARALDATSTITSMPVGTPAFMAPEQILAHPAGPAADMFAWASTMVFAAGGAGPFEAENVPAIIQRVLHTEPGLAGLTGPLRDLVAACLSKDPARRPTAEQVILRLLEHPATSNPDELQQAAAVVGGGAPAPWQTPGSPPPPGPGPGSGPVAWAPPGSAAAASPAPGAGPAGSPSPGYPPAGSPLPGSGPVGPPPSGYPPAGSPFPGSGPVGPPPSGYPPAGSPSPGPGPVGPSPSGYPGAGPVSPGFQTPGSGPQAFGSPSPPYSGGQPVFHPPTFQPAGGPYAYAPPPPRKKRGWVIGAAVAAVALAVAATVVVVTVVNLPITNQAQATPTPTTPATTPSPTSSPVPTANLTTVKLPDTGITIYESPSDPIKATTYMVRDPKTKNWVYYSRDSLTGPFKKYSDMWESVLSPDGRYLAQRGKNFTDGYDTVEITDKRTGDRFSVRTSKEPLSASLEAWSRDSTRVLVNIGNLVKGDWQSTGFAIVDVTTRKATIASLRESSLKGITFGFDHNDSGVVALSDEATQQALRFFDAHGTRVRRIPNVGTGFANFMFSPTGKQFVTDCPGLDSGNNCVYDSQTGTELRRISSPCAGPATWYDDDHLVCWVQSGTSPDKYQVQVIDFYGAKVRVLADIPTNADNLDIDYVNTRGN